MHGNRHRIAEICSARGIRYAVDHIKCAGGAIGVLHILSIGRGGVAKVPMEARDLSAGIFACIEKGYELTDCRAAVADGHMAENSSGSDFNRRLSGGSIIGGRGYG